MWSLRVPAGFLDPGKPAFPRMCFCTAFTTSSSRFLAQIAMMTKANRDHPSQLVLSHV